MSYDGLWGLVTPFALGEIGKPIHAVKVGDYLFDDIGPLPLTKADLKEMHDNFKANVRGQKLPITREHQPQYGRLGTIKDVVLSDDGENLYVIPDYNEFGQKEVGGGAWGYASIEFRREWLHPTTHQTHKNVLVGLTLTNYHRLKGLEEIAASEWRAVQLGEDAAMVIPTRLAIFGALDGWENFTEAQIAALLLADDTENDHYTPQSVRDQLPTAAFAFVKQRKILIHKPGNVQAGIARFMQVQGVSDSERDAAWGRLASAAKRFNITAPDSWRDLGKNSGNDNDDAHMSETNLLKLFSTPPQRSDTMPQDAETRLSEMQTALEKATTQMSELASKFDLAEKRNNELTAQLAEAQRQIAVERETRELLLFAEGLDKALREGRITSAQREEYLSEAPKMPAATREWLVKDIGKREKLLHLGETGSGQPRNDVGGDHGEPEDGGQPPTGTRVIRDNMNLATLAEKIRKEEKVDPKTALLLANERMRKGVK